MNLDKEWEHPFHYWKKTTGFNPIRHVKSNDFGERYEMNIGHVFELVGGKGALVIEQGCSCYESSDASIDLYPDVDSALDALEKWSKDKR